MVVLFKIHHNTIIYNTLNVCIVELMQQIKKRIGENADPSNKPLGLMVFQFQDVEILLDYGIQTL